MTDPAAFALAVLALLATPGPTNTLLAASGAAAGWRASLRLMPAELSAYLLSILTLIVLVGPVVAGHPEVESALKLSAGAWLAFSAVRLWREAGAGFGAVGCPIRPGRVFVTTLLNPKALIFALVVFPPGPPAIVAVAAAGFAALVLTVGLGWIGFGVLLARSAAGVVTPRRVSRAAALALALFASLLAGSAVAGVL